MPTADEDVHHHVNGWDKVVKKKGGRGEREKKPLMWQHHLLSHQRWTLYLMLTMNCRSTLFKYIVYDFEATFCILISPYKMISALVLVNQIKHIFDPRSFDWWAHWSLNYIWTMTILNSSLIPFMWNPLSDKIASHFQIHGKIGKRELEFSGCVMKFIRIAF